MKKEYNLPMNKWQIDKRITELQEKIHDLKMKLQYAESKTNKNEIRNAIAQQEAALEYLI